MASGVRILILPSWRTRKYRMSSRLQVCPLDAWPSAEKSTVKLIRAKAPVLPEGVTWVIVAPNA
jgi:hypothetical protein